MYNELDRDYFVDFLYNDRRLFGGHSVPLGIKEQQVTNPNPKNRCLKTLAKRYQGECSTPQLRSVLKAEFAM